MTNTKLTSSDFSYILFDVFTVLQHVVQLIRLQHLHILVSKANQQNTDILSLTVTRDVHSPNPYSPNPHLAFLRVISRHASSPLTSCLEAEQTRERCRCAVR